MFAVARMCSALTLAHCLCTCMRESAWETAWNACCAHGRRSEYTKNKLRVGTPQSVPTPFAASPISPTNLGRHPLSGAPLQPEVTVLRERFIASAGHVASRGVIAALRRVYADVAAPATEQLRQERDRADAACIDTVLREMVAERHGRFAANRSHLLGTDWASTLWGLPVLGSDDLAALPSAVVPFPMALPRA